MTNFYLKCVLQVACLSLIVDIQAQSIIFSDNFESGSFRPEWQLKTGQPNGVIEVTSTTSLEGNYAVRLGKSSDDQHTLNRLDLLLDLSGTKVLMLELMIYNNQDETHVQDGIYLSGDGGKSFEKIYDFTFEEWPVKQAGSLPPINLSALARKKGIVLSPQSVIRFQQYGKDDFTGSPDFSDGIYIDQITLKAIDFPFARLPYHEDFSGGKLKAPLMAGDPSLSDSSGLISPASLMEIVAYDSGEVHGNVLRMGSRYDKSTATNAIDLYLNLEGEEHVKMRFDFYDNRDETSPADGLFFSDNGGYSFTKVLGFNTDVWSDDFFGRLPLLDINMLASLHGLKLNSHFVVRIQQHGDHDFEGSRLSSDGIMIDNIEVFSVTPKYAQLPFHEKFETPQLASYWQTGSPYYPDMPTSISPNGIVEVVSMKDSTTAVRLGNTADRCYTTNALDLYIQLANHPNATLSFSYIDNYDETHEQDGIFFSNDGGNSFKKVFSFRGDEWTDKERGSFRSLNIRQLALAQQLELSNSFVIRFQQHDDDDFEGTRTISDGIYLDDIIIEEPQQVYASLPLRDDFEKDTLNPHWDFGDPMLTSKVENIRPGGVVELQDGIGNHHSKGLALGRHSDGKLTTNAVDLHLDLAGEKDLQLKFWLYNNYNELGTEDGLWFSGDGGNTFKKAWSFPKIVGVEKQYRLNLDSLVENLGLHYSNQFVVRFQQSDDRRFTGRGNMKGGLYLDDVVVAHYLEAPLVYVPLDSTLLADCREYQVYWDQISHSNTYRAQLFVLDGEKEVKVRDTVISTGNIKFINLEEDSTYFCRVQAQSEYNRSSWSEAVPIHTYQVFEATLQISDTKQEENTIVLQASHIPSYEYQWFRNGERLESTNQPLLTVQEPGSYSVYISNESCGVMSQALEVKAKVLGLEDDIHDDKSEDTSSAKASYGQK